LLHVAWGVVLLGKDLATGVVLLGPCSAATVAHPPTSIIHTYIHTYTHAIRAAGGGGNNVPATPVRPVTVAMDAEFQGPMPPQTLPGYSLMPQVQVVVIVCVCI